MNHLNSKMHVINQIVVILKLTEDKLKAEINFTRDHQLYLLVYLNKKIAKTQLNKIKKNKVN